MTDDTNSTYRRRHPVTRVTKRVVVRRVAGLRRRILWRLRELSDAEGRAVSLVAAMRTVGYRASKSSLWHIIGKTERRGTIPSDTFDMLTAALRMDEVDGWHRPWPTLPPASERRSLADTIRDELTAEGPGKD